ncbi:hypothetical protein APUTEX25_004124 [Auxenochlorella protothecoides]|uniref:J domain-containing protein n=1 Tax=Auxenochlorella protothecoides TaxID=3075 RepID=A0A3M7L5Q0_AUXPR|nr:hypothetical protein APUTEX25_004124 [Auxenochlorella protothecoides]|eukprot:RMZ57290.1 hypothetical protein APUTEX25_004124 [Auxenochlorella protothecoides]
MFAIFVLSLYSLYLIPYTLYKLCGSGPDDKVTKSWSTKKAGQSLGERVRSLATNPLAIQWVVYIALFWYTSSRANAVQQFDPFQILELPITAGDADIKKAYRRLSLLYHPDKNPDPSAADYFANYISKAYQALTDETSRENYQKYGHPDGPQAYSVSVALPEWFFSKDKNTAPIILLVLLFGGIVLPLGLAAWYLTRSNKYTGPNQLLHETIMLYAQDPRYGVKESQALARIPDTLVCAMEFILMPNAPGQNAALDDLRRRVLFLHPDLKEKSQFWKRRASIVKAHLLVLAHLSREPIPAALTKDANFILQKCPALLKELVGIACVPRVQPGYGWLAPALGSVEMMQHLVQAVPIQARKGGKGGEGSGNLLQLPGFDSDVLRRLVKKKVKTLADLRALAPEERAAALRDAGLESEDQVESVETALAALPTLWDRAEVTDEAGEAADGDASVLAGEVLTLRVRLALTRAAHAVPGFDSDTIRGASSLAYAPQYPFPKEEAWYFILGDTSANAAMCLIRASLVAAEAAGARAVVRAVAAGTDPAAVDPLAEEADAAEDGAAPRYQEVSAAFRAPLKAGRHVLTLACLPDSCLGCDRAVPIKVRVVEATRAEREGRAQRLAAAVAAGEDGEGSWEQVGASDAEEGSESGSEREEEEGEYDSDEYGTEESGGESEEEGDAPQPGTT